MFTCDGKAQERGHQDQRRVRQGVRMDAAESLAAGSTLRRVLDDTVRDYQGMGVGASILYHAGESRCERSR